MSTYFAHFARSIPCDLAAIAVVLSMPAAGLIDVNIIIAGLYKRLCIIEYDEMAPPMLFGLPAKIRNPDRYGRHPLSLPLKNQILRSFEAAIPDFHEYTIKSIADTRSRGEPVYYEVIPNYIGDHVLIGSFARMVVNGKFGAYRVVPAHPGCTYDAQLPMLDY